MKVATQTPPVRSGRRVVFLTVDDASGPVDATFFEDAQGPYAATVFHSWLLLVRGTVRRTGERGVSLLASGAWELSGLWEAWQTGGIEAVHAALAAADALAQERADAGEGRRSGAAGSQDGGTEQPGGGEGPRRRRVLVHASGYRQSPYADTRPAGESPSTGRKLWHASPGSSGW